MKVPDVPVLGSRLSIRWAAQVLSFLKSLVPISSSTVKVQWGTDGVRFHVASATDTGGDQVSISESLVLTLLPPEGYEPEEEEPPGIPFWVTWGTAGGVIPDESVFTSPLGRIIEAGNTYVWARIGISDSVSLLATSMDFVTSSSPTGYSTDPFDDGDPPEFLYVPLGRIVSSGSLPGLSAVAMNSGVGSIVPAIHVSNVSSDSLGRPTTYNRNLTYWRVQS